MGSLYFLFSVALGLVVAFVLKFQWEKNPSTEGFLARTTQASTSTVTRMAQCVVHQLSGRTPICNFNQNDLVGQLIVISGGNSGIGYETTKGLLRRGAEVIMVGRNVKKVEEAVNTIRADLNLENVDRVSLQYAIADMSDLDSVANLVRVLHHHFGVRQIDQLIINAAIWPQEYSISPQGYEIAFATNVAGPHLLLRALTTFNVLKTNARVISLTGDIYFTLAGTAEEGCSDNFTYGSPAGMAGQTAYSRSKLGSMWLFDLMHARHPALRMYLVHPGVMDNSLTESNPLPKSLLISNEQGAQTTLICATAAEALLESGAYYHNTLGHLLLPPSDPAKNAESAAVFWELVEEIISPYMRALTPEPPAAATASSTAAGSTTASVEAAAPATAEAAADVSEAAQ